MNLNTWVDAVLEELVIVSISMLIVRNVLLLSKHVFKSVISYQNRSSY